ncbi:MAG: xylose isomerase [Chitinivibrionales bacterium]|nr:xylose isomerase [Chitinivibrionales bacterium]
MPEFIPGIKKIKYEGPDSRNVLAFRHYNADEIIMGKKMKDHLRFAVAYWHTLRGSGADPFGSQTMCRPWDDGSDSIANAERRLRANFEFLQKLGVEYYCFHDRDIAPEGKTLPQSNKNLGAIVKIARQLQNNTGIKLLWGTANLFSHPRYMCGASTNPDAHVFAYAAAQVKKAMEVTLELGGENYVFWGGREGYQTLLNTDMKRELDHLARFLSMAHNYKKEIGFKGALLIEPKPKEPMRHQYDFDAATVIGFLKGHGLDKGFKLNIEANHATLAGHTFEHDLQTASDAGMLGSIDANTGDLLLGWDTDQFPMDIKSCTLAMLVVLNQGGIGAGGLNFDAKVRRESITIEDLFTAHIGGMDAFALGLKNAARIITEGSLKKMVKDRYQSWESGIGAAIESGKASFVELEKWALAHGEPTPRSGNQEKFESMLNSRII